LVIQLGDKPVAIEPIAPATVLGDERVKTDFELTATYIGINPRIKGKRGKCFYSKDDDKWAFFYGGEKYMVKEESLEIK
jgi:hypothetical protein